MLHSTINDQGNCFDVRDDAISEKINIFTCFEVNL